MTLPPLTVDPDYLDVWGAVANERTPVTGARRMLSWLDERWVLRLPIGYANAIEGALPLWRREHRGIAKVHEIGTWADQIIVIFDAPGVCWSDVATTNFGVAHVGIMVCDAVRLAWQHGVAHNHLTSLRIRLCAGEPVIFFGAPAIDSNGNDDTTIRASILQVLQFHMSGELTELVRGAPPGIDGLRSALVRYLDGRRDMIDAVDGDGPAIIAKLGQHGYEDALYSGEVQRRVWERCGDDLVGSVAEHRRILERLPQAEPKLIELLCDADRDVLTRVAIARILGKRRAALATSTLVQVLNEPLPLLRRACAWALARIPHEQGLRVVGEDPLRVTPCNHDWHELVSSDDVDDDSRFCADCNAPVKRAGDHGLAIAREALKNDDVPPIAVHPAHLHEELRLKFGDAIELRDEVPVPLVIQNVGRALLSVSALAGDGVSDVLVDVSQQQARIVFGVQIGCHEGWAVTIVVPGPDGADVVGSWDEPTDPHILGG